LKEISKLGLDALEVEFTYGVKITNAEAKRVGELAKKANISLSIHAPYYINLASEDSKKQKESIQRILDSAERGHYLGAKEIVFEGLSTPIEAKLWEMGIASTAPDYPALLKEGLSARIARAEERLRELTSRMRRRR
jgi:endonuclease IV